MRRPRQAGIKIAPSSPPKIADAVNAIIVCIPVYIYISIYIYSIVFRKSLISLFRGLMNVPCFPSSRINVAIAIAVTTTTTTMVFLYVCIAPLFISI